MHLQPVNLRRKNCLRRFLTRDSLRSCSFVFRSLNHGVNFRLCWSTDVLQTILIDSSTVAIMRPDMNKAKGPERRDCVSEILCRAGTRIVFRSTFVFQTPVNTCALCLWRRSNAFRSSASPSLLLRGVRPAPAEFRRAGAGGGRGGKQTFKTSR